MSKDTFEQNNKENIAIYYIDPSDEKQSILSCRKAQVQRAVYPIILLHFCRGVVPRRHQRKDRRVPQTIGKPGKGGKRFSNGLQILDCFFFFFLPGLGRTKIWACLNMVVNHQILGYHGIPYFRQTHIERNVLLFWWHGRRPVPQPSGWCSGWRRFSQPGWDGNAKCLEKPQVVKGSTNPSNKSSYPLVIKHDIHGGFFIKPCLIVGGTESTLEGNIWAWFDQTFWWVRTS